MQFKDLLQPKELLKKNTVTVVDGKNEVVKIVETPFKPLTRFWCRHEAECLLKLAELGFKNSPRLIRSTDESFTMEKIQGTSLLRGRKFIDEQLFLRIMDVACELHTFGFAHGNLRPNNIFIRNNSQPAFIDFETCSRMSSPLFTLTRFNDHVRLYWLWQSHVVKTNPELVRSKFPGYLPPAMLVITPIFKFWDVIKSVKKYLKRSLKVSTKRNSEPSKSKSMDAITIRRV